MEIIAQVVVFFFCGVVAAFAFSVVAVFYYAIGPSVKAYFKDFFSIKNGYVVLPSNI